MPESSRQLIVDQGKFPFPIRQGPDESRYLTWLRNHSNYMAVRGLPDYARAIGVLARGIAINFLVILPGLLIASVAVAIYSYPQYRAMAWMPIVGLALVYGAVTNWRRVLVLRDLGVMFAALAMMAIFVGSFTYWARTGFPLTATMLLFAALWSVLFAIGTPLFKIRQYSRTVATGSDSSVKTRDVYERSFGAFVLVSLTVFAFEAVAYFIPEFHEEVRGRTIGWPAVGSLTTFAFGVFMAANRYLSALGKVGRKLAITGIGLLGLLVPLLILLFLADFMRFGRPLGGLSGMLFVSVLVPVGLLIALILGRRILSWKDAAWGLVLVIVAAVLAMMVIGVAIPFVGKASGMDAVGAPLDRIADNHLRNDPDSQETVATFVARRSDSRLAQLPAYLEVVVKPGAYSRDAEALAKDYYLKRDSPEESKAIAEEIVNYTGRLYAARDGDLAELGVVLIVRKSALLDRMELGPVSSCSALELRDRMGLLGYGLAKGTQAEEFSELHLERQLLGCRLRDVQRELAATAAYSERIVPHIYASDDAALVRSITLWENTLRVFSLSLLLAFIGWLTIDVNLTSIHGLYRDRLASAFLVGVDSKGDVDIEDDVNLAELSRHDALSIAPYHLVNVALNLQGSADIGVRDRKSDYFIFSKRFIGGARTGYCRSESMEHVFPQMDLATAMAISAAAASPNMGRATNPALVALMALLNIRLGYWLPNPGLVEMRVKSEESSIALKSSAEEIPRTVWESELEEVRRRWKNLARTAEGRPDVADAAASSQPSVALGLVGIGYSGGGIRSATLNLGITQALHSRGVFDHIDYMSTVSGGGYLGSSISTLMRQATPTRALSPGEVRIGQDDRGVRVAVEQDGGGMVQSYQFAADANLAVRDGERVVAGQQLLEITTEPGEARPTFGQVFSWRVRPSALMREMIGKLDEKSRWVNVSDGGHIENLAGIELLRRRCKYIIIGDGEADLDHHFSGLATLIRSARIDLGVNIHIKLDALRLGEDRFSQRHWAIGRIQYPGEPAPGSGYLLYLKSSITGHEDEVIQQYRNANPTFPHESTADQFFTEGQFEAYRSLGQHIADQVFAESDAPGSSDDKMSFAVFENWFQALWENRIDAKSDIKNEQPDTQSLSV